MLIFEWILLLLAGAIGMSGIARRIGVPYPAFLALGGAAIAFLPSTPQLTLDPELVLALFVAPILLDAAYDTSLRDLKQNWLTVGTLAILAVIITVAVVAVVARLLVPDMPWPAAIALGAIVAPPDAGAATAVLRQVKLPQRLLVILEGESLLNDATALLIYRAAVAAMVTGKFSSVYLAPTFIAVVIGSVIVGWAAAALYMLITSRIRQAPASIVMQFVGTFGVWILADHIHLSAVLTVVVYGIAISRRAPLVLPARLRIPSFAVWETVVFVLNVTAFLLVGMQLRPIWDRLSPDQRWGYAGIAGAVLAAVILARVAGVMTYNFIIRHRINRWRDCDDCPLMRPTVQSGIAISWCGMRGIVTVAAALALPDGRDGTPVFPYRDLILLSAFAVVLGTLVLQGFTVRPLLKLLKLKDDGALEDELSRGRKRALEAALGALKDDPSPTAVALRREYEETLSAGARAADGHLPDHLAIDAYRRRSVAAARTAITTMRNAGEIGDAAFQQIESHLDLIELSVGDRED